MTTATQTHTPGPWRTDPHVLYGGKHIIQSGRGVEICRVKGFSDEGTANARLIAAAPTLADALRTIVQAVRDGEWDDDGPNDGIPRTTIYFHDDMITVAINALLAAGVTPGPKGDA